jgi:hypothetical protein
MQMFFFSLTYQSRGTVAFLQLGRRGPFPEQEGHLPDILLDLVLGRHPGVGAGVPDIIE